MITRIEVEGYRLLDAFQADLGQLTVAIGANATGKSTLQDLLRFVCQTAERPVNAVLRERGGILSVLSATSGAGRVAWRITFTKPMSNPVWTSLPIEADKELVYEASLVARGPYYGAFPDYEALRYAEPSPGYDVPFKFLEYRDGVGRVYDFIAGKFIDLNEHLAAERFFSDVQTPGVKAPEKPSGEDLKGIFDAAGEGPTLLLAQLRYPQRFLQASALRMFFASWAFYPGFWVGNDSPIRWQPADVEPMTLLFARGENLATVLHEILTKHEYRASAERIRDWLRSAYPDFEQVTAETVPGAKGKVAVRWHETGVDRPLDAAELSDGILRFLCLTAALNNPRPAPLVVIDEPETGLHPKLLPIVADMLKTAAEETQVLVTTHSPDLLNCFELNDIAVMVREHANVRWHRPGNRQALRTLLQDVEGQTLGDLHRSGELEAGA